MSKLKALTDANGEVRELTAQDMARLKPASDVLSPALREILGVKKRGAQKAPLKAPVTLRMDEAALTRWRASGKGWQTRAAEVLSRYAPR
jgi:uncharacterized protein (DUF4415 family)